MARQIGVLKRAAQTENNPRALVKIFTSKTAIRVLGEDSKLYRIIKMVYRARSASRREQGTLGQQVCTERARCHVRVHCGMYCSSSTSPARECSGSRTLASTLPVACVRSSIDPTHVRARC